MRELLNVGTWKLWRESDIESARQETDKTMKYKIIRTQDNPNFGG